MYANQAIDAASREGAAELLDHGMVYFDTSAWNWLADHPNREALIASLRTRRAVVFGSVISVAEILMTPSLERRNALCSAIQAVIEDRALLEPPLAVLKAAAEAILRGDNEVLLQQTAPGRTLLGYLKLPNQADRDAIGAWLNNSEDNLERFRAALEPPEPSRTRYHAQEIIGLDGFRRLLLELPPSVELGLSLSQVRDLCDRSDIGRVMAGTLGAVITQVMGRSPKRKSGHKRPGASDLWQAVYLGVTEVFVTSDERQLEVVGEVSAVLTYPRCVVHTTEFLAGLDTARVCAGPACQVCGCVLGSPSGGPAWRSVHARAA